MLNCLTSTEEHARETQRFRRPPRDGAEGGCHASHVGTLLRTGYPQIQHHGLCPDQRKREDARRDASFWDDDRGLAGIGRMAPAERNPTRGDGINGRVLEAGVEHLEPAGLELLLANAQEVKIVPGRKTDQKDSQWIADLHKHGLLRKSFVPPRAIRDLRDLTRTRAILTQEHTSICNRIQKVLEDANIKLGSVASDVFGVSGRAILRALMKEENDAEALADLSKGLLRKKIPQLRRALDGQV